MKFMLVVPVVLVGTFLVGCIAHVEDMSVIERNMKHCAEGTNITFDDVIQQFRDKFQGKPEYTMKCFFKCLMQHESWMTADGDITITEDMQEFSDCTKHGDDLCDRAFLFHKCIYDKNGQEKVFTKITKM